jgi:hypothetical protein
MNDNEDVVNGVLKTSVVEIDKAVREVFNKSMEDRNGDPEMVMNFPFALALYGLTMLSKVTGVGREQLDELVENAMTDVIWDVILEARRREEEERGD